VRFDLAYRFVQEARRLWLQSSTARNLSTVYLGDLLSKALGMVSVLILIRGLTVEEYAHFIAYASTATLLSGLIGNGLNIALVRFSADQLSRTGVKPRALYLTTVLGEVMLFLPIMLIYLFFPFSVASLLLGKPTYAKAIQPAAVYGLGLLLLQVGRSIYQAEQQFNLYIGVLWLRDGLTSALLIGIWLSQALSFGTVAWLIAIVHLLIGAGIVVHKASDGKLTDFQRFWRQDRELLHQFLSASGWLIAYFAGLAALSRMDVFLLSRLAFEEEMAVYGVAFQYYSMALLLLASIHAVLLPKFSRIEMQDPAKQREFLAQWFRRSIWTIVPILVFAAIGKPVFVWLSGVQYERSFSVLVVLALGVWLSLAFSPLVNILISRANFRFLAFLGMSALIFSLVANYLLVPKWGALGAAVATVLTHNVALQVPILWRVYR